jgi:hypothetical protein
VQFWLRHAAASDGSTQSHAFKEAFAIELRMKAYTTDNAKKSLRI